MFKIPGPISGKSKSDKLDEKLVALVRAHPTLYQIQTRSKPYQNARAERDIWQSIAASLDMSDDECQKRWRALLEKFSKEYKEKNRARKQGLDYNYSMPIMENMEFLRQLRMRSSKRALKMANSPHLDTISISSSDDVMYEAMEEQFDRGSNSPYVSPTPSIAGSDVIDNLDERIRILMQGLGPANRLKAERRILEYLCKCQVKVLHNENIDDIGI